MGILYVHTVFSFAIMDPQEWVQRVAARLHQQWPHVPDDQLREVAAEIQRELEQPEHAAELWLRQGMPNAR
jgi:hypothetical protein